MAQDTILGKSLYDFLQGTQKLKKGKKSKGKQIIPQTTIIIYKETHSKSSKS